MNSKYKKSFKIISLETIFPIMKDVFPDGEGNEEALSLLHFLHQRKGVKMEGYFHHGAPYRAIKIKCFLPEQLSFHEYDQIIHKIKETEYVLASLGGWAFDTHFDFPPESMKTKQIRFEIRLEKPVPGRASQKWGKDYQDFMLNDYPKIVEEQSFVVAEDTREYVARETGMDTYMKNRKIDQLVDRIDSADTLNELDLVFAFGTLVSIGEPTSSAVDKIKRAAKRQGCPEVKINRALEMYGALTGNILRGSDNNSSKPSQGEEDS